MPKSQLEISFLENFKSDGAIGLAGDGTELLIDSLLNDGLLKDIPVAGTLINLMKLAKNYSDNRFQKKILKFLSETGSIPADKRVDFIIELEDYAGENAGSFLIDYLQSLDHINKAAIMGKLLRNKVEGHISMDDYLRLCNVISRVFYYDLLQLSKYAEILERDSAYKDYIAESLSTDGLIIKKSAVVMGSFYEDDKITPEKEPYPKATRLGILLIKYGL